MRCMPWHAKPVATLKAGWNMQLSSGLRRKARESSLDALSRAPWRFVSTGARPVSSCVASDFEHGQNHLSKEVQSVGSWKVGSMRGPTHKAPWSSFDSLTQPTTVRQMSTSSNTAGSKAGVTLSFRETGTGGNTGRIATISVSNPTKMNIVNSQVLEHLVETCRDLSKDDSLRAVVLTGANTAEGKAPSFIGGADIKEMNSLSSSEDAKTFINKIHFACEALRDVPVPVIASVNGFSLGAGLEIMAACDLRLATKNSVFGMPEVKIGIPSVVEAALLPGLIGMGRTRRLLYLAEIISAKEALDWGLVEKVVEDEAALDSAVKEWSETIAAMGPKAIRSQKRLMQSWENSTVEEGIQAGVVAFAEAFADGGQEPRERMSQFINRKR